MSSEKKKDKDSGVITIDQDNYPLCSEHGYSLWIEEKNVYDNTAFCMSSDETIQAGEGVKITKQHISLKNMPEELEGMSGLLHED